MWCVGLFNSVYLQWNLYYNCKFTKFDTKLNVQIPVEFRPKVFTGTGTKKAVPEPEPEFLSIYILNLPFVQGYIFIK